MNALRVGRGPPRAAVLLPASLVCSLQKENSAGKMRQYHILKRLSGEMTGQRGASTPLGIPSPLRPPAPNSLPEPQTKGRGGAEEVSDPSRETL